MLRASILALAGSFLATIAWGQSAIPAAPAPGLTTIGHFKGTIQITNNTPYSLFTETLGAGLECIRGAIPATSIPSKSTRTFVLEAIETGSCGSKPSVGQQTFVIGAPGPEQRINAGFRLSKNINADNFGGGESGPFILSPKITNIEHTMTPVGGVVTGVDATWTVDCGTNCYFETTQVSVVNRTSVPLQVTPQTSPVCGAPSAGAVTAPPNGTATLQVTSCALVGLASTLGPLGQFEYPYGKFVFTPTTSIGLNVTATAGAGRVDLEISCGAAGCPGSGSGSGGVTPAHAGG